MAIFSIFAATTFHFVWIFRVRFVSVVLRFRALISPIHSVCWCGSVEPACIFWNTLGHFIWPSQMRQNKFVVISFPRITFESGFRVLKIWHNIYFCGNIVTNYVRVHTLTLQSILKLPAIKWNFYDEFTFSTKKKKYIIKRRTLFNCTCARPNNSIHFTKLFK